MASHLCHRSTRSFLHDCLDSGGEITMYLPPHADEMPLDFTAYNDEEENCTSITSDFPHLNLGKGAAASITIAAPRKAITLAGDQL